jgi:hypothetical protein
MSVEEMHAGLVGRVAIGDEAEDLILGQGSRRFAQRHGGNQGIVLRSDVIGCDVMALGGRARSGTRDIRLRRRTHEKEGPFAGVDRC